MIERNEVLYQRQFVRLIIELRNRKVYYYYYFIPFFLFLVLSEFVFFKPALCTLRGLIIYLIMEQLCEQTLKMMMMMITHTLTHTDVYEWLIIGYRVTGKHMIES